MDVVGRKVESQVQFWSLLGPSLVLLSIAVLLFKVSVHWYFPISVLIGIPLCVKWKIKGMVAALCCLFVLSGIGYQSLELDDRYWHVGLALTMAFSFIVLTLSLEEAQGIVNKLQLESQSRLDNFALLDEKWKIAEQEWVTEREKTHAEIATLTQELSKTQEDKQIFYKLAQLAKDELVQVRGQHDQLLQDLLYKKQQIAQLHERLEETEITIQGFVNSDAEKQIQFLTDRLTTVEREKDMLKAKAALVHTEEQAWQQEKEQLYQELQIIQEREKSCLRDQQRFQQDKLDLQHAFQTLQSKCLLLEQERNTLVQAQTGLQQQSEQMRYLEAQHRQSMQQAQRKIQDLEAKLMAEGQQKESLLLRKKELEEQLSRQEKQAKQREEQYTGNLQQLQEQLREQKEKAETQLKQIREQAHQQGHQGQKALEKEIQAVQERYQKAQEELLQVRQELKSKSETLTQVQQVQDQLQKQRQEAEKQLQQVQEQLKEQQKNAKEQLERMQEQMRHQGQQGQQALEKEIQAAQERYQKTQEELLQTRQELKIKSEVLTHVQQNLEELRNELSQQQNLAQNTHQQMCRLEDLKLELERALQQTQEQLQLTKQKLESREPHSDKLPYVPGNTRRVEAMYIQLKEQFQEKCAMLDATRRELFRANEELLRRQKEYEEEKVFGQSFNEVYLQRSLFQLDCQYERMQQQYQQEIDELTQLVDHLLRELPANSKKKS